MSDLAAKIYCFLDQYAGKKPDFDPLYDDENEVFTSPDASELKTAADLLNQGLKPRSCFSEWGSGGYKPYLSKEGRETHDYLVTEIRKII